MKNDKIISYFEVKKSATAYFVNFDFIILISKNNFYDENLLNFLAVEVRH